MKQINAPELSASNFLVHEVIYYSHQETNRAEELRSEYFKVNSDPTKECVEEDLEQKNKHD